MKSVAVLAFDGISPFHLSVPSLVFGAAGLDGIRGGYEVVVCAENPGTLSTAAGYSLHVEHGLDAFSDADMVVIPSWRLQDVPSRALTTAVSEAHARGARIVGLCLGSIVVAASGITDGREVATHWAAADWTARSFPAVEVRSDVLWSDLGDVVTSAGVAAALDCCLHIARSDLGTAQLTKLARSLVLAPHRAGSQSQFIPTPVLDPADEDPITQAMAWALARLNESFSLQEWAAAIHVSRRTFTRHFRERTGVSPHQWLLTQRIDHARLLLECGDSTVDVVAQRSGFGSAVTLRHHFRQRLGVSPSEHRAAFAG